jgi:transcriptional regulator with XRE-family HTH domain
MDISKMIRTIREEKRLTQLEVAEKLQMERSNYARLENRGEKLTIEQVTSIAEALGVSVMELLTGERPKVEENTEVVEGLKKEVQRLESIQALQNDKLTNLSKYFLERIRDKAKRLSMGYLGFRVPVFKGEYFTTDIDECIKWVHFINPSNKKSFWREKIGDARILILLSKYITKDEQISKKLNALEVMNMDSGIILKERFELISRLFVTQNESLKEVLEKILGALENQKLAWESKPKGGFFDSVEAESSTYMKDFQINVELIKKFLIHMNQEKQGLLEVWRKYFTELNFVEIEIEIYSDKWGPVYELVAQELREDILEILQSNVIIGNEELYRAFGVD